MDYQLETKDYKRIGIFSDLHIGVASDLKMRLDESMKCIDWIVKKFKEEKVDWIIFCGDLFNSRFSINVNTLNIGIEIIDKLASSFEKVFLIAGNHDIFYKNVNTVNSVKFLEKTHSKDKVTVIDEEPFFIKCGNDEDEMTFGLYPWGFDYRKVEEIREFKTPSFGFGHFDLDEIEMNGSVSANTGKKLEDLACLGKTLFSGHYHRCKKYKTLDGKTTLYVVGSILQLDWGDWSQDKCAFVLSPNGKSLKKLKNDVNAKFVKVLCSKLEDCSYSQEELEELCKGNFVKLVVDKQYDFSTFMKLSESLKKFNPSTIEISYLVSSFSNAIDALSNEQNEMKELTKTSEDILMDYIDITLESLKSTELSAVIEPAKLKTLAKAYYAKIEEKKKDQKDIEL